MSTTELRSAAITIQAEGQDGPEEGTTLVTINTTLIHFFVLQELFCPRETSPKD